MGKDKVEFFMGGFYECRGGWIRNYDESQKESLMIRAIKDKKDE